MPLSIVKSFADRTGKSESEIEKIWKNIKKGLSKNVDEDDPSFYPILVSTIKKKLNLESVTSFKDFYYKHKGGLKHG